MIHLILAIMLTFLLGMMMGIKLKLHDNGEEPFWKTLWFLLPITVTLILANLWIIKEAL